MNTYVRAKIHDVRVTGKSVRYFGSVTVGRDLIQAAGMEPFEQVHVINLMNGNRWVTYILPGDDGVFTLNGGGARLGEVGDVCVLITYRQGKAFRGAHVVFCGPKNEVVNETDYRP